jgi:hypothetical protein
MRCLYLVYALAFGLFMAEPAHAATELEQRAAVSAATQESFLSNDFRRLENVSAQYRRERSRTSSGLWNLTLFYAGVEEAIENQASDQDIDASFGEVEKKIKAWLEAFPESPSGHIADGMALLERAWAHRGGGYASTVDPEGWVQFNKYVALARKSLETSKAVASVDPKWYETMMIIARAQNWERGEFDALLNEALEKEPLFYQTYFSALEYLLPKWHGDIHEIENFAQDAAARTRRQEGLGMYARIYWYASQSQFSNDLFNNSLVEWSQMKDGFEDVIARYPDAWNLNNYARFACLAGDKSKTRELLKRIEPSVVAEAWRPLQLKQTCAEWASQP